MGKSRLNGNKINYAFRKGMSAVVKTEEQAEISRATSGVIAFWCFVAFFLCALLAVILDKIK